MVGGGALIETGGGATKNSTETRDLDDRRPRQHNWKLVPTRANRFPFDPFCLPPEKRSNFICNKAREQSTRRPSSGPSGRMNPLFQKHRSLLLPFSVLRAGSFVYRLRFRISAKTNLVQITRLGGRKERLLASFYCQISLSLPTEFSSINPKAARSGT